jgi:hypothetical protein
MHQFSTQLDAVRAALDAELPPAHCRTDLTCCVPESPGEPVVIELIPHH